MIILTRKRWSQMFGQLGAMIKVESFHGYAAFFKPAPL